MSIYEYDEEREMRIIRADERELGREEERHRTEEERRKKEEERHKRGGDCKPLSGIWGEQGAHSGRVMDKCKLAQDQAEEVVGRYWQA